MPEARGQGGGQEHPSWEQRVGISSSSRLLCSSCLVGVISTL